MREDLKPLRLKRLPTPDELNHPSGKQQLDKALSENEAILEKNRRRFEPAFRRMKLCMMIQGILSGGSLHAIRTRHFSWCPQPYWFNESGELDAYELRNASH